MHNRIPDFHNTEVAFKIKSNNELKRAYLLFRIIANRTLVKLSNVIFSFATRVHLPVAWIIKPTVYHQFCGGVSLQDCLPVVERLNHFNVKSILDYSVEGKENDEDIEKALEETLKSIEFAGSTENIPFTVFKPTAFSRPLALEELSNSLNPSETAILEGEKFRERIELLCRKAYQHGKPILIDAEDSYYQTYIDKVVMEMMRKYNHSEAIVFNTYQMYRWDRLNILRKDYEEAVSGNFFLGAKFVRGAYMERERERAEKMNYPDPIHPDKESTDRDYNEALRFSVEHIDRISIFNGTHNEYSSMLLVELGQKKNLQPDDNRIWFSQLYGMSDHISFNLAKNGYNVAKYVPYGPVKHVLPYLMRRAEENTAVAGQTSRELEYITREIKRRKR